MYYTNWDFGDGNKGIENAISHTYTAPGNYKVQITACNQNQACDTISKMIEVGTNFLAENHLFEEIKIYPNPATTKLYFEGLSKPFEIKIYNPDGKILYVQNNFDDNQININQFQQGFYILEIKTNDRKLFRKFLKVSY
jgi:hypothetical protein